MSKHIFIFLLFIVLFLSNKDIKGQKNISIQSILTDLKNDKKGALKHTIDISNREYKNISPDSIYILMLSLGEYYTDHYLYDNALNVYTRALKHHRYKKNSKEKAFLHNRIGKVEFKLFNIEKSISCFRKSIRISKQIKDSTNLAYTYNCLAKSQSYAGNNKDAILHFRKSLSLYLKLKRNKGTIITYNNIGDFYESENMIDSAKVNYLKSIKANNNYYFIRYKTYSYIRISYVEIKNKRYCKALDYQNKAFKISERINYKEGMARALLAKASTFMQSNHYTKALKHTLKAREINKENKDLFNAAKCSSYMGEILSIMGNSKDALKEYTDALEYYKKNHKRYHTIRAHIKIGNMLNELNRLNQSNTEYNKALELLNTSNNAYLRAKCLIKKGYMYIKIDIKVAEKLIHEAKDILIKIKKPQSLCIINFYLGLIELEKQKIISADEYFKKSLILSIKSETNDLTLHNYEQLYKINEKINNYKQAFIYSQKYNLLKGKIRKIKTKLEIDWNTLEQENKETKEKNIRLKTLVNQKTKTSIMLSIIIILGCFMAFIIYRMYISMQEINKKLSIEIKQKNKARKLLEDHKTKLEETVYKRTKQLVKAKNKAEQADILKTKFLANMSHEIRTPLNAIVGFAEILSTTCNEPSQENFINIISINSDILLHTVNNIITMSLIETKQLKLYNKPVQLSTICSDVVKTTETRIIESNKNIKLKAHDNTGNIIINFDQENLTKSLINILINAIRFTEQGEITFEYKLTDNKLIFLVSDTGIGIDEDELSIIFKPFRQGSNNMVEHGGTGLGLSISKAIIELMGGNISVKSERHKGSIFKIIIPITNTSYYKQ